MSDLGPSVYLTPTMAPRARFAFFAWLALIALPFTLPGRVATAETGDDTWGAAAEAWTKATYKLPSTETSARVHPADGTFGRSPHAPFAPATLAGIGVFSRSVDAPASRSESREAQALVALPPSRAPPALS
jgi:hypothetical protein